MSKPPAVFGLTERVVSTFLQAFVATLLAAPSSGPGSVPWADALSTGGFAALTAVATSMLAFATSLRRLFTSPPADLAYRTVLTFVQTFVGLALAAVASSSLSFDYDTAIETAVVAAATALLKALVGYNAPTTEGASTFVGDAVRPSPSASAE